MQALFFSEDQDREEKNHDCDTYTQHGQRCVHTEEEGMYFGGVIQKKQMKPLKRKKSILI